MLTSYFILCFLSCYAYSNAGGVENEDSITLMRCRIWDHECQKQTAQMAIPTFAQGLPDLGTRRLDPLREPFVEINHDGAKKKLSNFVLRGFANSIVNKASFDIFSKTYRLRFIIPVLTINATYSSSGFMHEYPFNGNGEMYLRANDVEVDVIISFDVREDNRNRKFLEVTKYFYSLEVLGNGEVNFENLNADNPKLGTAVHTAFHQNWKAIAAEYGKFYFEPLAKAAIKALTQFCHSVDLATLYSDI